MFDVRPGQPKTQVTFTQQHTIKTLGISFLLRSSCSAGEVLSSHGFAMNSTMMTRLYSLTIQDASVVATCLSWPYSLRDTFQCWQPINILLLYVGVASHEAASSDSRCVLKTTSCLLRQLYPSANGHRVSARLMHSYVRNSSLQFPVREP